MVYSLAPVCEASSTASFAPAARSSRSSRHSMGAGDAAAAELALHEHVLAPGRVLHGDAAHPADDRAVDQRDVLALGRVGAQVLGKDLRLRAALAKRWASSGVRTRRMVAGVVTRGMRRRRWTMNGSLPISR